MPVKRPRVRIPRARVRTAEPLEGLDVLRRERERAKGRMGARERFQRLWNEAGRPDLSDWTFSFTLRVSRRTRNPATGRWEPIVSYYVRAVDRDWHRACALLYLAHGEPEPSLGVAAWRRDLIPWRTYELGLLHFFGDLLRRTPKGAPLGRQTCSQLARKFKTPVSEVRTELRRFARITGHRSAA